MVIATSQSRSDVLLCLRSETQAQVENQSVVPAATNLFQARQTPTEEPKPSIPGQFVLQDGTPVKLRLNRNVSSEDATVGESVDFEVLEEVAVNGVSVIPKGGVAIGSVTEAQSKRRMARGGKLEIVLDYARLADSEKAAVRAVKDAKGGGHTGGMTAGIVATGLLFWPAAPFFLFMHGKDITVPKGAEITAYVNGDMKLNPSKFAQLSESTGTIPVGGPATVSSASALPPSSPTLGSIEVHSNPDSAEVYADGSFVGNTPATLKLNPGQHTIRVTLNSYKEWTRELMVQAGSDAHLAANLEKLGTINASVIHGADAPPTPDAPPTSVVRNEKPLTAVTPSPSKNSTGWIGVSAQTGTDGALVTNVTAGGPGAKAGIQVGDVILALDGRLIKGKNFETAVASIKPGSQITVNYTRESVAHETAVMVSPHSE
jgi:PDZ domain/PEGA domain